MSSTDTPGLAPARSQRIILFGAWMIALSLVLAAVYLGWRTRTTPAAASQAPTHVPTQPATLESLTVQEAALPEFNVAASVSSLPRRADLHTIIPSRPRQDITQYTVSAGDSVFGIAQKFNIEPETVLWANYDQLNDSPDLITPGMDLNIPPINGVYYQWEEGDSFESVAAKFETDPAEILSWPGNQLDLTNPQVEAGEWIMVPGGHREFRQWIVPTIARENSGVSRSVLGQGACEGSYSGAYGSGAFAWPTASHFLSGNDYWSGHLGIDIAGSVGDGVFASDAGVVVFAGWAVGGYGYMVMIDHGNGYQTLYAHLSSVSAYCGQSVYTGTFIGGLGSTGNSTGPHLHFEVRYLGGFISPWYVLPPP